MPPKKKDKSSRDTTHTQFFLSLQLKNGDLALDPNHYYGQILELTRYFESLEPDMSVDEIKTMMSHDVSMYEDINEYIFSFPEFEINKLKDQFYIDKQKDGVTWSKSSVRCGRCKENNVVYYEKQIRSGDEGMTSFFNCLNCQNRWRN